MCFSALLEIALVKLYIILMNTKSVFLFMFAQKKKQGQPTYKIGRLASDIYIATSNIK